MKYHKHAGAPASGVALRADPAFGEDQRPTFDYVAVGCGSAVSGLFLAYFGQDSMLLVPPAFDA